MALDKELSLPERQRLAAERTHEIRRKATESRIRGACRSLQQQGAAFTQAIVAKAAGVSRQTVANFKHVLEEVRAIPQSITEISTPLTRRLSQAANALRVKFGEHQVTAALARPRAPIVPPVNLELFPAVLGDEPVLDG